MFHKDQKYWHKRFRIYPNMLDRDEVWLWVGGINGWLRMTHAMASEYHFIGNIHNRWMPLLEIQAAGLTGYVEDEPTMGAPLLPASAIEIFDAYGVKKEVRVETVLNTTGYDKELKQFVDAMTYKLMKNRHKGRWEGATIPDMVKRLKEEVAELEEALSRGSEIEIILEAADCANFSMIIANIAIKKAAE